MSDSFWTALDCYRRELMYKKRKADLSQSECEGPERQQPTEACRLSRDSVIKRIEECICEVLSRIADGEPPVLRFPTRTSWTHVEFDEKSGLRSKADCRLEAVQFSRLASLRKFTLIMKVLSQIHALLQSNTFATKRDLYYEDTELFGSQAALDGTLEAAACILRVPRWQLNVTATSKGCIAGSLQFTDVDGSLVDCSKCHNGVMIPNLLHNITDYFTGAKYVMVIEKDATFQRLLDEQFCQKYGPCILVTGKGYPDVNTRMLLKQLWNRFSLPTFALVDADPHGLEIMSIYKFGSRTLASDVDDLAVPELKWIGLLPSDIQRLAIPSNVLISLTARDRSKAKSMMQRARANRLHSLERELQVLVELDAKAELQSLNAFSATYLTDVYLYNKLRYGLWI